MTKAFPRSTHGNTWGEKNPVTPDRSRRPDSTSFPKRPKMLLFNAALTNENTFDCHLFPLHVTGTGHERHNNLNNARPIEIRSAIEFFFFFGNAGRQTPATSTLHDGTQTTEVRRRSHSAARLRWWRNTRSVRRCQTFVIAYRGENCLENCFHA